MTDAENSEWVQICRQVLLDKKAEQVELLPFGRSSLVDCFLVASATSEPHLRAIEAELRKVLKENGLRHFFCDYRPESGWLALDLGTLIVHVFLGEMRRHYRLETLKASDFAKNDLKSLQSDT